MDDNKIKNNRHLIDTVMDLGEEVARQGRQRLRLTVAD
jgi:hypothetical protein